MDNSHKKYQQRIKALVEVGKQLTKGIRLSENDIFQLIYEQATNQLGMENLSIALYSELEDNVWFVLASSNGTQLKVGEAEGFKPRKGTEGKTGKIITSKQPLRLDTKKEIKEIGYPPEKVADSWLGVPMIVGEKVLGVIATYHYGNEYWYNDDDIEILQALADLAAIAIENARLYEEKRKTCDDLEVSVKKKASDINAFYKISEAAHNAKNLVELYPKIHKIVKELMFAKNFRLVVYDSDTETLNILYDQDQDQLTPDKLKKGLTGYVLRERKPLISNNEIRDKLKAENKIELVGQPSSSWLGFPIELNNNRVGLIVVQSYGDEHIYTEEDMKILSFVSEQIFMAIERVKKVLQQKALINLAQMLKSSVQLNEMDIFKLIYSNINDLSIEHIDNMYIAMYDEETNLIRFPLAYKEGEPTIIPAGKKRKEGIGRTEEIINTKKPIIIHTKEESIEWYKKPGRKDYMGNPFASWMGVPMIVGEKVLGVIATYHPTKDYVYTEDDLEIFQTMANIAAIAFENARFHKKTVKELTDEIIAARQIGTLSIAFGAIQHRISNTFNIIHPNVRRLRKRVDPNDLEIKEILDIIERNAKYTADIISRIQEPLKQTEIQTVDINAILNEIQKKAVGQWLSNPSENIKILLDLDESIPYIKLSSGLISEVFRNLFDNAHKAMKRNGGTLTMTSEMTKNKIYVRIQDMGAGIPTDIQERLFKKPVPSKDLSGGSGLGLWLNRLILLSIGGKITVEKSDNTGTTMLVTIPVHETEGGKS